MTRSNVQITDHVAHRDVTRGADKHEHKEHARVDRSPYPVSVTRTRRRTAHRGMRTPGPAGRMAHTRVVWICVSVIGICIMTASALKQVHLASDFKLPIIWNAILEHGLKYREKE